MTPVVDELGRLIAFPSISNRPLSDLAAHVAQRCEDLGFQVERFDDPHQHGKCSIIASIGPPETEGLVLSGHMDVVPTEGQPWDSDPFVLTERDGRLFGRGTADMKGFFAATFQALARIERTAWKRELVLIWTHDEEVGCLGSRVLTDALLESPRPLPRACLIGEPTDFRILRMHPGHVAVEIEIFGQAAHSSRPDLGINAIEGAAEVILAVRQIARELEQERADLPELERPWVAMNIARIKGGSAINIVPDRCVLQLGYRPLPGMEPEAVFERIRARLGSIASGRLQASLLRITPSMLTPAGTALESLLRAHASHPVSGAAGFATDGGNLSRLGMQPLIFGPGSIDVAHQANEYVDTSALVQAVDVLEAVIRARCC